MREASKSPSTPWPASATYRSGSTKGQSFGRIRVSLPPPITPSQTSPRRPMLYLDKFQSKDGKVTLQFLVKSDVAGTVRIQIKNDLKFSMLQTQSWPNPLDSTFRVDRTLKVMFNQVETLPIDAVTPPAGRSAAVSVYSVRCGWTIRRRSSFRSRRNPRRPELREVSVPISPSRRK